VVRTIDLSAESGGFPVLQVWWTSAGELVCSSDQGAQALDPVSGATQTYPADLGRLAAVVF